MSAEYWIWLQQVLGYGNEAVGRVIAAFGDAESFYRASDADKISAAHLGKAQISRLHSVPRKVVYGIMRDCAEHGIEAVTPSDSRYPERLLNIADPPAVLYVKGSRFLFNGVPAVAVVGPRSISEYGERCGYVISNTLASCGFTVISGGAVGGDSAAHNGAIDADGVTVGVLGAGIESDYLKVNAPLRESISRHGCLISEYPPFLGVMRGSFQRRNRIISGLSNGVVILEGTKKSGTMITAKHACEQGRDVFVIPGIPTLPQYEGSNRLISDGARPLLNVNEIINEYIFLYPDKIHKPASVIPINGEDTAEKARASGRKAIKKPNIEPKAKAEAAFEIKTPKVCVNKDMLSDSAKEVLSIFEKHADGFTADDAAEGGVDIGAALTAVTELEIFGFIEAMPGGRYRIKYQHNNTKE